MQDWCNGSTSVFQTGSIGSSPLFCSKQKNKNRKDDDAHMAMTEMGSFGANVAANVELVDLIHEDIEAKLGRKTAKRPLRHITIYGNDGDIYFINGHQFEIRNGSWGSPNNNEGTLVEIRSIRPGQPGFVDISYLR